ncbi:unnamed protein product [Phytomonas sp. EM1]|nr:unnamed protein product [Phytomonas sp. EM1]|eukprot:CCW63049.1 unnamed protein product [Phytomonas sp. isolate EM1]
MEKRYAPRLRPSAVAQGLTFTVCPLEVPAVGLLEGQQAVEQVNSAVPAHTLTVFAVKKEQAVMWTESESHHVGLTSVHCIQRSMSVSVTRLPNVVGAVRNIDVSHNQMVTALPLQLLEISVALLVAIMKIPVRYASIPSVRSATGRISPLLTLVLIFNYLIKVKSVIWMIMRGAYGVVQLCRAYQLKI